MSLGHLGVNYLSVMEHQDLATRLGGHVSRYQIKLDGHKATTEVSDFFQNGQLSDAVNDRLDSVFEMRTISES